EHAAKALDYRNEPATVVLLSDGQENCAQDPCAMARQLKREGADFQAHVIGFRVDAEARRELQCVARATGGRYTDARNADQLFDALQLVTLPREPEVIGDAELILPELREGRYNLTIRLRDNRLQAEIAPANDTPRTPRRRASQPAELEPLSVRPVPNDDEAVPLQEVRLPAPLKPLPAPVTVVDVRDTGLPEDGAAARADNGVTLVARGLGDRLIAQRESRQETSGPVVEAFETATPEAYGLLPTGPLPVLRMLAVDLQAAAARDADVLAAPVRAALPVQRERPIRTAVRSNDDLSDVDLIADEPLVIGYGLGGDEPVMDRREPVTVTRPNRALQSVADQARDSLARVTVPADEPLTPARQQSERFAPLRLPLARTPRPVTPAPSTERLFIDDEPAERSERSGTDEPLQVRLPEATEAEPIWQIASLPGRRPQQRTARELTPADPPVRARMPQTDVILEVLAPQGTPSTEAPLRAARLDPAPQGERVTLRRPVRLQGRYDFVDPTPAAPETVIAALPPQTVPQAGTETATATSGTGTVETDAAATRAQTDGQSIIGRYRFFKPLELDDITDEALLADGIFGPPSQRERTPAETDEPDLTIREARLSRGASPPTFDVGPSDLAETGSGAPGAVSSFPNLSAGIQEFTAALDAIRDDAFGPPEGEQVVALPDDADGETATTVVEETTSTLAIEQRLEMSPPAARELQGPRFARIEPVQAGFPFKVAFVTPQSRADWVAIARPQDTSNEYISLTATKPGETMSLRAPSTAGTYEVRYISSINGEVLSRQGFTVGQSTVSLTAQKFAEAGDELRIWWKGPGLTSDKVVLARKDMEATEFLVTRPVIEGNPVLMDAPDEPGVYELRYINGTENVVMFRADVTVTKQQIALALP
ncbi:MAG: hypothetical protein AAGF32_07710, partial [Pseudomonadota bacterium]